MGSASSSSSGSSTSSSSSEERETKVDFWDVACKQSIIVLGLDGVGRKTLLHKPIEQCPDLFSEEVPKLENDPDRAGRVGYLPIHGDLHLLGSYWQDIFTVDSNQRKKDMENVNSIMTRTIDAFSSKIKVRTSKHTYRMYSWIVGYAPRIRPLWRHYCTIGKGLVFIVDITDTNSDKIEVNKDCLHWYLELSELEHRPLLLLLNKVDLLEDHSNEGISASKQRWMEELELQETAPYDCSELASVMEVSYLAERSNRELIQSLSNEIHALLFGHSSVSVKSMLTHSNPLLRRPIRVQPCSVLNNWQSVNEALEWLFWQMKD